jgi:hypothetical protein
MKAFVLSEWENIWSGFLLDRDCDSDIVKRFFPGTVTSKRNDLETVLEAREEGKTIVTSNERDFIRYTKEVQKKDNNKLCEDCWGLVVLPNRDFERKNALQKANIKSGLTLVGRSALLPWKAAAYANLCLIVQSGGTLRIQKFERCQFCEADTPINQEWYKTVPLL